MCVQSCTGSHMSLRARAHPGAHVDLRERAFNESCIADALLGSTPGSRGRYDRQPYWLTESLVAYGYYSRASLVATSLWPSASQPQLAPAQLHPTLRRAAAALLRLSLNRYSVVAHRASRALAALPPVLSLGLPEVLLPAITAGVALLAPDASADVGGVPLQGDGSLSKDAGSSDAASAWQLPSTDGAAAELLSNQAQKLTALVTAASGTAGASVGAVVDGDAAAAQQDGVCTSENKHVAIGALALLTALQPHVLPLLQARPQALCVLIMSAVVTQSYILPVRAALKSSSV